MRRKILMFAGAGVLAAGILFSQTPAAEAHPHLRAFRQHRFARLCRALDLTDAQKQQAKAVFEAARQQVAPVRDQLKQNHQAMAAAVKAGKSDAEIQQLSATTGTLVGQLAAIRAQAMAKVYATLTPEQRQKADALHQRMQTRMQRWRSQG